MIDNIGKQAVTVHVFINDIQDSIEYNKHSIPHVKMRLVKKVINKFLRNMKNSDYYYLSDKKWSDNFYQTIVDHVDIKLEKDGDTSEYLTWIQYQIHSFIQYVYPDYYDGVFRVKRYSRFYKQTLEMLLR